MLQTAPPAPSLQWCLFLDVDGTLVELTDSPLSTVADAELKTLLGEVAERLGGSVALVSGRSIHHLDALFDPLRLPAAGLHGVERRKATGVMQGASFVDSQLDRARTALAELMSSHPGTFIEDKGRTIAMHYRMAPQFESNVRQSMIGIAKLLGSNYQVQEGSMVLELKPRGFNKGGAVQAFMREPPFAGRTPVFVGDDLTDLDGFKVAQEHGGMAIAVGDRVSAPWRLEDPAAVRVWLKGIAALTDAHRA